MKNYKLTVTETGNKNSMFHYKVIDESGKVVSERKSNRIYVACTANGSFYFGRTDLIFKGDHGRALKIWESRKSSEESKIHIENLKSIAYKN